MCVPYMFRNRDPSACSHGSGILGQDPHDPYGVDQADLEGVDQADVAGADRADVSGADQADVAGADLTGAERQMSARRRFALLNFFLSGLSPSIS